MEKAPVLINSLSKAAAAFAESVFVAECQKVTPDSATLESFSHSVPKIGIPNT